MDLAKLYNVVDCDCPICSGTGKVARLRFWRKECPVCRGGGTIPQLVPTEYCLRVRAAAATVPLMLRGW